MTNCCKFCGTDIHPQMGGICVACWALEQRIKNNPEIAEKILNGIKFSGAKNRSRS